MSEGQWLLPSAEALEEWGREFSAQLRDGNIIKITGPLGAGKTTLVRGLAAGLGVNLGSVHSPTFALVHEYQGRDFDIKHCDFYRLPDGSGLEDFGGLEFFDQPGLFFVEWPERLSLWPEVDPRRLIHADLQHDSAGRILRVSFMTQIVD